MAGYPEVILNLTPTGQHAHRTVENGVIGILRARHPKPPATAENQTSHAGSRVTSGLTRYSATSEGIDTSVTSKGRREIGIKNMPLINQNITTKFFKKDPLRPVSALLHCFGGDCAWERL
jgi:hypothetical protein